ncbi:MAG: DUF4175 family protein [Myxococcota bacterium]
MRTLMALLTRQRRHMWLQVGPAAIGVLAIGFTLAVTSAHLGWLLVARLLLLVFAIAGAALALAPLRRRVGGALGGAYVAELLADELGSAARSAVELSARLDAETGAPFSRALAAAHIEVTAGRLTELPLTARLDARHRRPRRVVIGALVATLFVSALVTASLRRGRARLLGFLPGTTSMEQSELPLAADMRVTYRYPAYTGLGTRVVEGGDGSLQALAGTQVTLEASSDERVRGASLELVDTAESPVGSVAVAVAGERRLQATFVLTRDGGYRIALVHRDGERVIERRAHPIRLVADEAPQVSLTDPATDVELRDDRQLTIRWRAIDDFGVGPVSLVVEPVGGAESHKILLLSEGSADKTREGTHQWSVDSVALGEQEAARIYVEAWDNDTVGGPHRGISSARTVTIFSARRQHERLLEEQRLVLDRLVDLLARELTTPAWSASNAAGDVAALATQQRLLAEMQLSASVVATLVAALGQDELAQAAVTAAYENVLEHLQRSVRERVTVLDFAQTSPETARPQLADQRVRDRGLLEDDIIYLDDLLALERINAIKETAKELLAAQRELQDLLERYRQSGDAAVRKELEQRIRDLRSKMTQLLARMSEIKQRLPGEYRNIEAATMMRLDEQVRRLEQMLGEGDLEAAAAELQSLANMVENMVSSLDEAQAEYGGERYAAIKKQLDEFSEQFRRLESEQQALTKRNEDLLRRYREQALKESGGDLADLVARVRREVIQALESNDQTAAQSAGQLLGTELTELRARLLDMQALLDGRDFAKAREMGAQAAARGESVTRLFAQGARGPVRATFERAARQNGRTRAAVERANELLDKLFPDPSEVLSPEQMQKLRSLGGKQRDLRDQAEELGGKMAALAEELPLFGGSPRDSLELAQGEMGQASLAIGDHELSEAVGHERRALDALGGLRKALQQAAKQGGGKGGMPLPLALGGHGGGGRGDMSREEVAIPQADAQRANPAFRQKLIEAAKQRAPERYEDMVRRYYEELIR